MKTKLTLLTVFAAALFLGGCSSLSKGLVAHYPLNGNANDESGNRKHGRLSGTILKTDRHGNTAGCYEFSGGYSDYFKITGVKGIKTVSLWLNLADSPSIPLNGHYLVDFRSRDGQGGYVFGNDGAFHQGFEKIYINGKLVEKPALRPIGKWAHVVLQFDDGLVKRHSSRYPDNILTLMNRWSENEGLIGALDDVRIYNRALSVEEVKALYDLEKPKGE
jgi:hypothetical protein